MHFLTVLLDSMLELNSSQIVLRTFLDSLLSSNWWFSSVFALLVTIFHTSPSFYLSYHLCLGHLCWFPQFVIEEDCPTDTIHKNLNKNAVHSACFHWKTVKPVRWTRKKKIFPAIALVKPDKQPKLFSCRNFFQTCFKKLLWKLIVNC